MEGKREMVQILSFDRDPLRPRLNTEIIESIIGDARCSQLPFLVVSVAGSRRSGKSFLVNLLITYLQYLEENSGDDTEWLTSKSTVAGVNWEPSRTSVTHGIWMLRRPFIVQSDTTIQSDTTKVAVLLMDCQGLHDIDKKEETIDAIVALYALELSSIYLLNIRGDINVADLQNLESCVAFAKASGQHELFNTLMILYRDWQLNDIFGVQQNYFSTLKSERKLNRTELIVNEAFRECHEFMLPHPGLQIRRGTSMTTLTMQDLLKEKESQAFLNNVRSLCQQLFVNFTSDEKHLAKQSDLVRKLQKLKDLHSDYTKIPHFHSPAEVMERVAIQKMYQELRDVVWAAESKSLAAKSYSEEQEIKEDVQKLKGEVESYLAKKKREMPATTELGQTTWREVEENVNNWLSRIERQQMEKYKSHELCKINKKLIGVTTAGASAVGAISGALGVMATGGILAAEAVGLGMIAAGAAVGAGAGAFLGATSSIIGAISVDSGVADNILKLRNSKKEL